MAAGIVFVVLFLVGILLSIGNTPDIKDGDSDAVAATKYVNELASSANRAHLVVAGYVLVVAAIAFVWFTNALRAVITSPTTARLVSSLGIFGAMAITAGAMISITPAGIVSLGNEPQYDGHITRALVDLLVPFVLIAFGLVSAAIAGIVAFDVTRSRALPRWVGYAGWVGALGGLFAVEFTPFALTLLWFLVLAITGLVRPPATASASATPAFSPAPAAGV
jgi:hypothetical protein